MFDFLERNVALTFGGWAAIHFWTEGPMCLTTIISFYCIEKVVFVFVAAGLAHFAGNL